MSRDIAIRVENLGKRYRIGKSRERHDTLRDAVVGTFEVWGDGTAIRSYAYVDDMVDGIYLLMQSDLEGAVNIGCPQYVSVNELVDTVAEVAGKAIHRRHIDGPVGVHSHNFSNERIYSLGWKARVYLKDGIAQTYPWIAEQVRRSR